MRAPWHESRTITSPHHLHRDIVYPMPICLSDGMRTSTGGSHSADVLLESPQLPITMRAIVPALHSTALGNRILFAMH